MISMDSKLVNWVVFLGGTIAYMLLLDTPLNFIGGISLIAASACLGNLNIFRIPSEEWLTHLGFALVALLSFILLPSLGLVAGSFTYRLVHALCILFILAPLSRVYWYFRIRTLENKI